MIWLYVSVMIIAAIAYVAITNDRHKSRPSKHGNTIPKAAEGCKDDLDGIELYVDELDENGEPW